MKNKIVQSLWVGEITPLCEITLISHMNAGHDFHLYIFDGETDVTKIPKGVKVFDASEILQFTEKETDFHHPYAIFADLFRYELLYKKGGIWVDMDMFCNKYYDFSEEYVFGSPRKGLINIGFIKVPKRSNLMKIMKNKSKKIFNSLDMIENTETGSKLFSSTVKKLGLIKFTQPIQTFYPNDYKHFYQLFINKFDFPEDSYSIHLWGGCFRDLNVKYTTFPEGWISEIQQKVFGERKSSLICFEDFKASFQQKILKVYNNSVELTRFPVISFEEYLDRSYAKYVQESMDLSLFEEI
jgi:hypothetical protein